MFLKTEKLIYYLKIEIFLKFYLYHNKKKKKKEFTLSLERIV